MFYSKLIFKKQEEDIFLLNPRYKNPGNKDKRRLRSTKQQKSGMYDIRFLSDTTCLERLQYWTRQLIKDNQELCQQIDKPNRHTSFLQQEHAWPN